MPRADAANAVYNPGNFLGRLALDKLLKAPQRHVMHLGAAYTPAVIELDLDRTVSLDAGYGSNVDYSRHVFILPLFLPRRQQMVGPGKSQHRSVLG